jgi:hypothetical protein
MLESNSMGQQLGQSYQDTIENISSKQESDIKYIFQTNLFEGPKYFNKQRFLKKLNSIKLIEIQIKKWLNSECINQFEKKKIYSYNDSELEKIYKNPIIRLISDIAFNGLETYLIQIIKAETKKRSKTHYCKYLNEILIISDNAILLTHTSVTCKQYLNYLGLHNDSKNQNMLKNKDGINFLGFQLRILKKNNNFYKKISISKESKKLLLARTRFIIQKNKAISSYFLIMKLKPILLWWGKYFQYCECNEDFAQMDNKVLNQLRAWVFRRKAQGKNRNFLKEKYFPNEKIFTYQGSKYKNNWVLSGELKTLNKNKHNFLPKLYWIKKQKYLSVKNNYTIYNGNYAYWSKRLKKLDVEQKLLLQTGFIVEGKIEIYNLFTRINPYSRQLNQIMKLTNNSVL